MRAAFADLRGHYAFVAMHVDHPDLLVGARKECPLIVGIGDDEAFLASAIPAFLRETRHVLQIESDEIVTIDARGAVITDPAGGTIEREVEEVTWDEDAAEKAGYPTFMMKEIHEQPEAVAETIADRLPSIDGVDLSEIDLDEDFARSVSRIVIVACGTSYHAGLVGRYAIELWTRIPIEMDIASEYRYRNPVVSEKDLVIGITQSGETADTLAAMRLAKERGAKVMAITNVMGSQATRDSDTVLYTRAGLEIGVAATKTFTAQVAAMYLIGLWLAQVRGTFPAEDLRRIIAELKRMPSMIEQTIESVDERVRAIARAQADQRFFLYLGRNIGLPVCLEGALKLREISYIPTDAYAAGEMKHGPIALLDESTPVVCVATDSPVLDKVLSNVSEVRARGADVVAIATEGSDGRRGGRRPHDLHPEDRLGPAADPRDPAAAAARLLHRAPQWAQRRPAAKPGEDGHGRVTALPRRAAVVPALAVLALAGCGGDDEEAMSGPATLVPASSVVYAESVLRPEGEQSEALESSLGAILGTDDPGAMIVQELNEQLVEDDAGVTYEGDIEPWLGGRGAVFFTELYGDAEPDEVEGTVEGAKDCVAGQEPLESDVVEGCAPPSDVVDDGFTGEGVEGAFVVEATDPEAAQAFAEKAAADDGPEAASYEGVDYTLGEGGDAYAVVGDAVAFGSEAGVKAVIDTEQGGESLAGDADFAELLGAEQGAAGSLFVDIPAVVSQADEAGEIASEAMDTLDTVFVGIADEPLSAVVDADPGGFGLDVSYGATDVPFLAAAEESALLRELPGDSWFAAGFSGVGEAIGSFVESADDFGVAEDEIGATGEQFRREFGLDLEDFYAPLGDGAVYANGEGIFGTGGGLIFQTDDPEAAKKLIDGLERAAKRAGEQVRSLSGDTASGFSISIDEVPGGINFVAAEDRIVIAYGDAATSAAIDPGSAEGTLADSAAFGAAEEALGSEFSVTAYLDFGPIVELLDLAAAADPSLQQALPYIESLDFLISGSSEDGERIHQKTFLGVADIVTDPSA